MKQHDLDTFKVNVRKLYSKGKISQRLCVSMLGVKLPTNRVLNWAFKQVAKLTSVVIKELK